MCTYLIASIEKFDAEVVVEACIPELRSLNLARMASYPCLQFYEFSFPSLSRIPASDVSADSLVPPLSVAHALVISLI
jgi:hypothetical protein